jgi:hypothetical protein
MSVRSDLEQQILDANAQILLWNAALLADAANPQKDYSLDGESVSRDAWRRGLMDLIRMARESILETQKTINALNPYAISTRQVL